jgi:hypothetical protein
MPNDEMKNKNDKENLSFYLNTFTLEEVNKINKENYF